MKQYLILIDNDENELQVMKKEIEKSDIQDIKVKCILKKSSENDVQFVLNEIEKIIKNCDDAPENLYFHIAIDACLTETEHQMGKIYKIESLTGVSYLYMIRDYMIESKCKFCLSFMSEFFFKQLIPLQEKLRKEKNNHFFTVVRKPFLDSKELDFGASVMPQYAEILPEEMLSNNFIQSFVNILIYPLKEHKYEIFI